MDSGNQLDGHCNSAGERWSAWTPAVARGVEGSLWVRETVSGALVLGDGLMWELRET